MATTKNERKYSFYVCGRCKGRILFYKTKPKVCPECGYGHGSRDVNSIPFSLRLNLRNLSQEDSGSRGKLEQTTISSR
jgi:ribosomal protein L37E